MIFWDIPVSRIKDSTFWTVLLNLQLYPSRKNTAEFLHTIFVSSMDPENSRILKLGGRTLENYAASLDKNTIQDDSLLTSLSLTSDLSNNLLKKLDLLHPNLWISIRMVCQLLPYKIALQLE